MSGGAYDYAYRGLHDLAYRIRARVEDGAVDGTGLADRRIEFARRLDLMAVAARAIELTDSRDGDPEAERSAIDAALGDGRP